MFDKYKTGAGCLQTCFEGARPSAVIALQTVLSTARSHVHPKTDNRFDQSEPLGHGGPQPAVKWAAAPGGSSGRAAEQAEKDVSVAALGQENESAHERISESQL